MDFIKKTLSKMQIPTNSENNNSNILSKITPKSPALSAPKTPSLSAPKSPALSAPKSPALSAPKSPALSAPKSPALSAPKTPSLSAPKSLFSTPKSPALSARKTPSLSASKTPSFSAPKSPALSARSAYAVSPPKSLSGRVSKSLPYSASEVSTSPLSEQKSSFSMPYSNKSSNFESSIMISDSDNIFSKIFNFKLLIFILLIIFVLAILGVNFSKLLMDAKNNLTLTFNNVIDGTKKILSISENTITNVSKSTADGVDKTIKTADNVTHDIDNSLKNVKQDLKKDKTIINTENEDIVTEKKSFNSHDPPEPVRTYNNKSGYCFVGNTNDTRYCAKVSNRSLCMSGDIYPSKNECINQNIRA